MVAQVWWLARARHIQSKPHKSSGDEQEAQDGDSGAAQEPPASSTEQRTKMETAVKWMGYLQLLVPVIQVAWIFDDVCGFGVCAWISASV